MMKSSLQKRLARVARILDRSERFVHLAFMDEAEADRLLQEYEETEAASKMDDGTYPAGPRNEKNKSRYKLEPGHSQHLSDLLRSTATKKN